jgi:hypothetical protein
MTYILCMTQTFSARVKDNSHSVNSVFVWHLIQFSFCFFQKNWTGTIHFGTCRRTRSKKIGNPVSNHCEICRVTISPRNIKQHVQRCQLYSKFFYRTSRRALSKYYACKLCIITRNSARYKSKYRKSIYAHIRAKHSSSLPPPFGST